MQLHPAEGFVIEGFEMVNTFAANKAGPREEMSIHPCGPIVRMGFLNHHFYNRAFRRIHIEAWPTDDLFREFKGGIQTFAFRCGGQEVSGPVRQGFNNRFFDQIERTRNTHVKPVTRVAVPANPAGIRQPFYGDHNLPGQRYLPRSQGAVFFLDAVDQVIAFIVAASGRFVGRAGDWHGVQPFRPWGEAGRIPAKGMQPRIVLLLERSQIPAFVLARRMGPVQICLPGGI
ncbi:MAG: hypothetical protein BWY09_02957 [Candidatus Hydrogenedentes bacterium ADurb.Bin179]|nr:MAG: hypothetical protein BWY09_02957 [Candidatus Hydrogenedentes bacterium ADurb.Bin179]